MTRPSRTDLGRDFEPWTWSSRNCLGYGRYWTDTRVKINLHLSNERGFSGFVEKEGLFFG